MSEPLALIIPHAFAAALSEAVAAGEYASVDDALADALDAWSHRHEDREEELAWIRAEAMCFSSSWNGQEARRSRKATSPG